MSKIPTGETPYSIVCGTKSIIPVEIGIPSFRTMNFDKDINEAELTLISLPIGGSVLRYVKLIIRIKSPSTIIRGSNIDHFFLATWS